jgi:hypothetical protein
MTKITLHPRKHEWSLYGDFVDKRDSKGIVIVERIERCDWCARQRSRLWNVRRWEKASKFYYKGELIPLDQRMSVEQANKAEFLATTTIKELK